MTPADSKDTSLSEEPSPITSPSSENGVRSPDQSPDSDSHHATKSCPHAGKGVELKAGKIPKVASIPSVTGQRMVGMLGHDGKIIKIRSPSLVSLYAIALHCSCTRV